MTNPQIVLTPGEDGMFVATCPDLEGCVSQGRTGEEALANAKEAASLHGNTLRLRIETEHGSDGRWIAELFGATFSAMCYGSTREDAVARVLRVAADETEGRNTKETP